MSVPFEIASVNQLQALCEQGVVEYLHLDYKAGRGSVKDRERFKNDLAVDVAAFANADGGTIIVGVKEAREPGQPHDIEGIDTDFVTAEAIEQSLLAKVSPRIAGLRIHTLVTPSGATVVVIEAPKSMLTPHQGPDGRYYRRYERTNRMLGHDEVEDLFRRRLTVQQLVEVSIGQRGSMWSLIEIKNQGLYSARDVTFTFEPDLRWEKAVPLPILEGIASLSPGMTLSFMYLRFADIINGPDIPKVHRFVVEYLHPVLGRRVAESGLLDFTAFRDALGMRSDSDQHERDVVQTAKEILSTLKALRTDFQNVSNRLVGADGLCFSTSTWINVDSALRGDGFRPLSPDLVDAAVIRSVLGVDWQTANHIESCIERRDHSGLSAHPMVSEETIRRLSRIYDLSSISSGKGAIESRDDEV